MHAPDCEYLIGCFKARDFQNIFPANTLALPLKRKYLRLIFLKLLPIQRYICHNIDKNFSKYWNVDLSRHLVYPCSEAGGLHPTQGGLIGL